MTFKMEIRQRAAERSIQSKHITTKAHRRDRRRGRMAIVDWGEAVRVMKAFAIFGMVCMLSQPATAVTCDQVRSYVGTYGVAAALSYAKKIGATAEQIRDARSCLLRASKDQPRTGKAREVFAR
jgi:hypothetical protein